MNYRLLLKNDRIRQYNLLAVVVGVLHMLIFIALILSGNDKITTIFSALGMLLMPLLLMLSSYPSRRFFNPVYFLYSFLIITWCVFGYYWVAPVIAMLGVLHFAGTRKLAVTFSAELIDYPSIPRERIYWKELNNVVLKDGFLTIDFKNDRLLQQELDPACNVDEAAFNTFAKAQLIEN